MRHIHPAGLDLIKRFEGFSPVPYADVAGKPTIGYGHLLKNGEQYSQISEAEAEVLLQKDLAHAEQSVSRLIQTALSDGQFAALVSFTFNLGSGALQRSTLRQKLNRGEYAAALEEFPRWVWAGGRQWPGLLRRRRAEMQLYKSDI